MTTTEPTRPPSQPTQVSTTLAKLTLPELSPKVSKLPLPGDHQPQVSLEECHIHRELYPCPECSRQAAERELRKRAENTRRFTGIQIGKRYHSAKFADYLPTCGVALTVKGYCESFAASFSDRLEKGDNVLMVGNPGTGKNMLAACICSAVSESGFSVLHTQALKLVRRIRESWNKDSEMSEQEAIDEFTKPDLLVIDEVGIQYGTEAEKLLLFEVINGRYEDMRPTILISNLDIDGITHYLMERIIDRFHEGESLCLEFTWASYRRGNR